jgi:hypothetical protein
MSLGSPIFLVLPREALERSFVMTDYSIMYHCTCGWRGKTLPTEDERCSVCGEIVGASAMMTAELAEHAPREFVQSPCQQRRRFPREFWARMLPRFDSGELTINPQVLAHAVLPYFPPRSLSAPPAVAPETVPIGRPTGRHVSASSRR